MKSLFLLLGLVFSLMFSGFAVADQAISSPGLVKALPCAMPAPACAVVGLLSGRIGQQPSLSATTATDSGHVPYTYPFVGVGLIGHYDTDDPSGTVLKRNLKTKT